MLEDLTSQLPFFWIAVEHRLHKGFKKLSLILPEAVPYITSSLLSNHDVFQRPVLQFWNPIEAAFFIDVFLSLGASHRHLLGKPAHQLHYLSEMIVVFAEVFVGIFFWVE